MAIKYNSDGTYTKGDGKLYYPGLGVVGIDKSSSSSNSSSNTSTNKTTTTTNKNSATTANKTTSGGSSTSSGVTSMYKKDAPSNTTTYPSKAVEDFANKTSNTIFTSTNDAINKVKEDLSNGSYKKEEEVNIYDTDAYKELQNAYNKQQEQMNQLQGLLNSNEQKYNDQIGSLEQKYNDLLNAPNPYENMYNELQDAYNKQEEAIKEQNRLAVEQGVNRLNSQKSNINQSAEDNARQAYIMHMQAQKALPQQLASQGVSGGATETANLGLSTTYQNNLNDINRNKVNALQDIDNAIVDLQNTGDLSAVEQVLANNQAALNAYTNNLDKQVGYNQWAAQFNANRADTLTEQAYRDKVYADQMAQQQLENNWYNQSYADNKAQQELENNRYDQNYADQMAQQALENQWYEQSYNDAQKKEETNRVITLLENGLYNPETASALLGIPVEQLQSFVNYINKARNMELSNTQSLISNRNSSSGSSSSGGSGSNNKNNQTYSRVLSAIQKINTTAGQDYSENLAAARYLLNSDLTMENKVKIMKQTNVRPEAYVREMFNEGKSDEDIMKFVEEYTPNQEYRNSLFVYAHQ